MYLFHRLLSLLTMMCKTSANSPHEEPFPSLPPHSEIVLRYNEHDQLTLCI